MSGRRGRSLCCCCCCRLLLWLRLWLLVTMRVAARLVHALALLELVARLDQRQCVLRRVLVSAPLTAVESRAGAFASPAEAHGVDDSGCRSS